MFAAAAMSHLPTIYYLHQYFKHPSEGGAIRSYHVARGLVSRGWKVKVITAWNNNYLDHTHIEGVEVIYLPVPYRNQFSFLARIRAFLHYMFYAVYLLLKAEKKSIIFATSTPLTVGLAAVIIKKIKNIPYVFEVRDLWPQAAIDLGFLKNKWFIKLARYCEQVVYRHARCVIALSEPMARSIKKSLSANIPVEVVPNFSDNDFFNEVAPLCRRNERHGGKIVICYLGTVSTSKAPEAILNLIKAGESYPQFHFIIAGEGGELQPLMQALEKQQLHNYEILPFQNKYEIRELLMYAHFALVSFVSIEVIEAGSPNKFFDALAAGVPVLLNFGGWLKHLVEAQQLGLCYEKGHEAELLQRIMHLMQDPHDYDAMAQRCKQTALQLFDKNRQIEAIHNQLLLAQM